MTSENETGSAKGALSKKAANRIGWSCFALALYGLYDLVAWIVNLISGI